MDLLEHDNGAVGSAVAVDAPALAATHHHRSMRRRKRIKESQTRGDEEAGGCSMAAVEEKRAGMQDAALFSAKKLKSISGSVDSWIL